jgi:hypothetical protein
MVWCPWSRLQRIDRLAVAHRRVMPLQMMVNIECAGRVTRYPEAAVD